MHDLEYAKQILQYAIQVQQLADAIKNSAHGGPAALSNIGRRSGSVGKRGPGWASTGVFARWAKMWYFGQLFRAISNYRVSAPALGTYQSKYSQWAQTSLATTQGILRGVGLQGKLLATEQGVLSVLRLLSSSNLLNQKRCDQSDESAAAEQVGQLQKLRELQLEDMTSKAAYQGYVIQRQAASEAATQHFFNYTPEVSDGTTFQSGWK